MKFEEFLKSIEYLPVIETKILLAGTPKTNPTRVQISRWEKAGKLIQLKRGIYLLAEPYRKVAIYELYLASILKKPSYVSLEKALEYHGLIPEAVSVFTSVTPARSGRFASKVGVFDYKHIKTSLFWGYNSVTVNKQTAFIASPEKALLDFFYLKGVKISADFLIELRLQNYEGINLNKLFTYAKQFKKPRILYAAEIIKRYISSNRDEEKTL